MSSLAQKERPSSDIDEMGNSGQKGLNPKSFWPGVRGRGKVTSAKVFPNRQILNVVCKLPDQQLSHWPCL